MSHGLGSVVSDWGLRAVCAAVLCAATWASTSGASAQSDEVRLRDGGLVRGTVIEWIPGDHVAIESATGELLRFPASVIESVSVAPSDPVWPGSVALARAHVRFVVATDVTATVHLSTGSGSTPICALPCEADLDAGIVELAVSLGEGGAARRPDHFRFELSGPSDFTLEHEDRSAARIAGWVTFGVLLATASGFVIGGFYDLQSIAPASGVWYLALAAPISAVLALAVGVPLASWNDHLDLSEGVVRF